MRNNVNSFEKLYEVSVYNQEHKPRMGLFLKCNFKVLDKNDELLAFLSCLLFPDIYTFFWKFSI